MSLSIEKHFTVDASPERIWDILVNDFENVAEWVSGLDGSGPNPKATVPIADGAPTGRSCVVPGLGSTDERIVRFDASRRSFAYSVDAEKIPGFVEKMTNTWTLTPAGNSTKVDMHLTADVNGPLGAVMKPMLRRKFERTLRDVQGDLIAYAETGRVSAKKAKELATA